MERAIAFVLEQQAQLTATVDRVSERVDGLAGKVDGLAGTIDRLTDKVDRTADSVAALLTIAEIQAAEIKDLTESTRALANRQLESEERGRRTDERLDALINIVERHISEGHGRNI